MSRTMCKCVRCGVTMDVKSDKAIKLNLANRGGRSAYICTSCGDVKLSYGTENNEVVGKQKVNGMTYGIEFKTSFASEQVRVHLFEYNYIPTKDSSIEDTEFISPIYQGLNKLPKMLYTLDGYIESGELEISSHCGTHFHVGHVKELNYDTMRYIRDYYGDLFCGLSYHLEKNPEKCEALFGRYFNDYAESVSLLRPFNVDTSSKDFDSFNSDNYRFDNLDRYNFINVNNHNNIEYRLCKFVNSAQYMLAIKFCSDATKAIINNFLHHLNDSDYNSKKFPTLEAYRVYKARLTCKKIVKLFDKYSEEAMKL